MLVADFGNNRVCKFNVVDGAFIDHSVIKNCKNPSDVLQCEDGSIMVAQFRGLLHVTEDEDDEAVPLCISLPSGGVFGECS